MKITAEAIVQLRQLAKKANLTIEQYAAAICVQSENDNAIHAERRSSPVSKEAITNYLSSLNGELDPDLSRKEICANAGVPWNQGNSSFARHEVKRLLALRDQRHRQEQAAA